MYTNKNISDKKMRGMSRVMGEHTGLGQWPGRALGGGASWPRPSKEKVQKSRLGPHGGAGRKVCSREQAGRSPRSVGETARPGHPRMMVPTEGFMVGVGRGAVRSPQFP